MKPWAIAAGACFLLSACASRKLDPPPETATQPESADFREARALWEAPIPCGMSEREFWAWIEADCWASGWMGPPRTLSAGEVRAWAMRRAEFVGHIHQEAAFQSAVAQAATFRVYSCQGIPSTGHQFTVLCAEDSVGEWRVVYRAVRERPCF